MKEYKIFVITFIFLFLTGCGNENFEDNSINYNLEISDSFDEKITFILPKNAEELAEENKYVDYTSLEYALLYEDQNPIFSNKEIKYKKSIDKNNNNVIVKLNYEYSEDDFLQSNYIRNCFEKYVINSEKDYIEIRLSGEFYCLYDRNLNLTITSNHQILQTNGLIEGDKVKWNIDDFNYKNVNLTYKIQRDYNDMSQIVFNNEEATSYTGTIISVVIMSVVGVAVFLAVKVIKKKYNI